MEPVAVGSTEQELLDLISQQPTAPGPRCSSASATDQSRPRHASRSETLPPTLRIAPW